MDLSEALGKGKQSVYRGHPVYGEGQPERLEEVISSLKSKGKVLGACLSNPGIVSGQAAFMSSVSFDSDITRTQSWERYSWWPDNASRNAAE